MTDDAPIGLTIDQYAHVWQISPRQVRRMIKDGRLDVIRFGRLVRILVTERPRSLPVGE